MLSNIKRWLLSTKTDISSYWFPCVSIDRKMQESGFIEIILFVMHHNCLGRQDQYSVFLHCEFPSGAAVVADGLLGSAFFVCWYGRKHFYPHVRETWKPWVWWWSEQACCKPGMGIAHVLRFSPYGPRPAEMVGSPLFYWDVNSDLRTTNLGMWLNNWPCFQVENERVICIWFGA